MIKSAEREMSLCPPVRGMRASTIMPLDEANAVSYRELSLPTTRADWTEAFGTELSCACLRTLTSLRLLRVVPQYKNNVHYVADFRAHA